MVNISYYTNSSGNLAAKWPGVTVYTDGKPRKEGQMNLGLVVNEAKNIFWNRKMGFCHFNIETHTLEDADPNDIPPNWKEVDHSRKEPPVCVDFGDTYFLHEYIHRIGYDKVIDSLQYQQRERLYSLLHFYMQEDEANCNAESWYRQNYIRLLYPKANITSQRISDMLAAIGTENQKRAFLLAHIEYVLNNTDEEVCVLIDSTGLPNSCDVPITRISNHEGAINVEFRMVALVQKSTGLPIYFELVSGNIVDVSTVQYITEMAKKHGCKVLYMIGDAGYNCPANIEKMILSGIDFMTRINPTYEEFATLIKDNLDELNNLQNNVRFHDRIVRVYRIEVPCLGKNIETGKDVPGYIYLCKDTQSEAIKKARLLTSDAVKKMTTAEIEAACERLGIFAIITTCDLPTSEVLPEYYVRQSVEQFFDFGKNYAKFLPVREHNMNTILGHMIIAFMASFLFTLLNRRLKNLDSHYTGVAASIIRIEGADEVSGYVKGVPKEDSTTFIMKQDPLVELFRESPSSLFYELRGHKAQVFDDQVITCVPTKQAKDMYSAFRLSSPVSVTRSSDGSLTNVFADKEKNTLTKKVAFSFKLSLTDDEIQKKQQKASTKKLEKMADAVHLKVVPAEDSSAKTIEENANETQSDQTKGSPEQVEKPEKKRRGRKPGSKNKKTLEREAREAEEREKNAHRRGRKPGSLNKKTLERLQKEQEESKKAARNARRRELYAQKKRQKVS